MTDTELRQIVNVDRLNNGIVLKFADGQCVFFSTAYLYARIAEGEPLDEAEHTF